MIQTELYTKALIFQFAISPLVLIFLFFFSAPYGKFTRTGWGPRMDSLTAWMLMEIPAVFTIATCAWFFRKSISWGWVFLLIWEFNYIYRTFVFPAKMHHGRKTFPVSMVFSALFFNILNGFINGVFLFYIRPVTYSSWFSDPRFILGVFVFFTGFSIHVDSDRRIQEQKSGPGEYIIPQGSLFRWVSCPNYLGEMIQWFGWAGLCGFYFC